MQGNELMRILNIAAFAVSGYASTEGRQCKPFNPLLGETYEADYPDKGLRFFSEKVVLFTNTVRCQYIFGLYKYQALDLSHCAFIKIKKVKLALSAKGSRLRRGLEEVINRQP